MEADAALDLLNASHTFPGSFRFRVVVRTGETAGVVSAIAAAVGEPAETITERPSRKGTYVSLRVQTPVQSAQQVLDVYAVLKTMDEVLATL